MSILKKPGITLSRISEWMSGRVFRIVHGNNLVYNTCWEDPRIDKQVLNLGADDNLLVITSAGCNALSYALTGLNHIYAVDMNPRQNALLELKIAGIRQLDYDTFFQMFGNGHITGIRGLYEKRLRHELSPWSQRYWDKRIKRYFDSKRKSFYFCGTTGAFARIINGIMDRYKLRGDAYELLASKTLEEQKEIWFGKVREKLWSKFVKFLINRDTTLSMLGVPKAQRKQIEMQYDGGVVKFVQDCLDAVFGELPIQDNYFWRVYATGSYTPSCCPEYLEEKNFTALKDGLVNRISTHTSTVEGFLRGNPEVKISRFVLLDHMDWLSHHLYDALVSEWDAILKQASDNTKIIWRSGGLRTEYIDTVPAAWNGEQKQLGSILTMHPELSSELHKLDRVHTYGSFYIADLQR
ncbi:S-adenosylmethionine--diacylglycerol 3-amino-3-carboxypropyl transferase [Planctomycetales bacterium]|nr:S-adenosylmethionine--diacylglycerol 3-amino-3-carboxypropyl transferase [Planctomycetales bacterium]